MPIDLRSDTVTLPSDEMRAAMAAAPVGDDQYGEDPSMNALQERVAEMLGKQAALFLPSGTMANQVALRVYCRHGDDVVVGEQSHAVFHETGAAAALSGVQFTEVGQGGLFTADDLRAAAKPRGHNIYPPTTLVEVENTHNRGGGLVFKRSESARIAEMAAELGIKSFLDGARLFNAAIALNERPADLAQPFDMVAISLSKGLGAPVGSLLAGTTEDIATARRYRRMFGGAMRQSGMLAAAGMVALDRNIDRLGEDHETAKALARKLEGTPGLTVDPAAVQTNIVIVRISGGSDAFAIAEACRKEGVLVLPFSSSILRLTTHLQVSAEDCARAGDVIIRAAKGG